MELGILCGEEERSEGVRTDLQGQESARDHSRGALRSSLSGCETRSPTSTSQESIELAELEKKLGYKDIRFYRSIARSEMRKERATARYDEVVAPAPPASTGWLGWVGWGATKPTAHEQHANGDGQPGLNEEQRKELYKAIDWDEKDAVATVDLPKEAMMLRVKAKLETGSFALRTDPHGANRDLISLNFDAFQLDLVQRPENFDAVLALGGLRVFDGTCEGSVHQQIVRVKESKIKERALAISKAVPLDPEDREADDDEGQYDAIEHEVDTALGVQDPFFSLKFEHNPLDGRADNALAIRLRHMEIIYHRGYVEAIVAFFKPPESQLESVGALIDVASSTLEGITKETRAGLEYALAQHKTVDLHLDLNAVRPFLPPFLGFRTDASLLASPSSSFPRR